MKKNNNEITIIPKIKLHPSKIILYNELHYSQYKPSRKNNYAQTSTLIQVEKNGKIELQRVSNNFLQSTRKSDGELSKQAIKRLKLAIEYLLIINKPNNGKSGNTGRHYNKNITFITLTLPSKQLHTDKEIKEKCLNQFMIELHKHWRITNYVWRAEYQKNGNIHFHIITNRFIPWEDIRVRWNRIIKKLGYIDNYRKNMQEYHKNGFKINEEKINTRTVAQQLKAYNYGLQTNWQNPNSTDIHQIANVTNIKSYLIKYLSKTEKNLHDITGDDNMQRKEIGRLWAASTILSKIQGADTELDTALENNLDIIKEHFKKAFFYSDYFTIIDITIEDLRTLGCHAMINLFYSYMLNQFNYNYQHHL